MTKTKQRRRREMEAAAAVRRLTLVARGPGPGGAGPGGAGPGGAGPGGAGPGGAGPGGPSGPDDADFDWFERPGGRWSPDGGWSPEGGWSPDGGRPSEDPWAPDDGWRPDDGWPPDGTGAGPSGGPGRGPGPGPAPMGGRWRELAADRVPVALRGAAGVPVTAAVAVLLVVLAVVVGVTLRARATRPEVVDLAPATRSSARAADAGSSGGALPAGSSTGAGSSPGAGVSTGDGAGQAVGGPGGAGSGAVAVVGATGVRASGAGPAASAPVVVDVVGKVRRPGLVRLPPGSRVADAVAAAGGPTDAAALARINLARVLADGEQVVVPDADDPLPALPAAPAATSGPGGAARPSGPLDLNTATAADLDELPGVGPVLAGRIVEWRSQHQRFTRVDELAEVAGIGDKVLERLRPLVAV